MALISSSRSLLVPEATLSAEADPSVGDRPAIAADAAAVPVVAIRPPRGWQSLDLRELWRYRELLFFLVWRDVKVRYKQTALGAAWAILQPLLMMVVFAIFFGRMAGMSSGDVPYPLFVLAGLLPWTFFATAVAQSGHSVVGSERLVSKIYFPRLVIPYAPVGAAAVDFLIACGLLGVLMAWYGVWPGPALLLAPLVLAALALAALGVGTLLAALNVRYRDFRYVIPFLIQFWMFATPTVYMQPSGELSGSMELLLTLNPISGLVAAFRAACLGGPFPWGSFAVASACAVALFLAGSFYFRRVESSFADII
jgi:lipopolysaccharide transport system permease protein